jgi:hypothetical protein
MFWVLWRDALTPILILVALLSVSVGNRVSPHEQSRV